MAQARHIGKIVITHHPHQVREAVIQPDATYLITGGLGGLGLQTAGWLIDAGAQHLVLVGRSHASQAARDKLQAWQQSGVQIEVAQADVASIEQLGAVITAIEQEMPPLRGVIHAAGVLDDGLLINQDWSRFESVFAPKIQGAWNLHVLTQNTRLDFFTLFSAGAALLGSSGQASYAAANAFLDGLAHYRRAQGLPALSINWGAWAEVGMAAAMDEPYRQRLSAQGVSFIQPLQGMAILEQLIAQDAPQTAVLPMNWTKMAAQGATGKIPAFLSDVMHSAPSQAPRPGKPDTEPKLLRQLEMAAPGEKHDLLITAVRDQVVKVLGLNPAKPPELRQGLTEIGMDSLMAVELSNRLKALLGQPLPATLAFEYPSIYALVDYLETQVLISMVEPEAAQPPVDPTEAAIIAELEALSDSEIEATLLDELKKAGY
jgi:NAD(P)-dependent dehydrogenase (short-subunit alcohol dehydrogenase family)/acyl carrier protein